MVEISPRKLSGKWIEGYALDVHTTSSTYLGDDEYGHPQFDTRRSEMGDLLYRLKYRRDESVLSSIVKTVVSFIHAQNWTFELVIPVPPSNSGRRYQPVIALSEAIASQLGVEFCPNSITKVKSTPQLKNVYQFEQRAALLDGAYSVDQNKVASKRLLVLDDLYRSGATLNSVCQALIDEGKAEAVHALTLTMTRSHR
jgi:competence protein ComFC